MTVLEAIALFKSEMVNEIGHSFADDASKDSLIRSVNDVEQTVIETYEAGEKK